MLTRTNYVLVHGARHGAWCWARLRETLIAQRDKRNVGEVVAPDLPGHGARKGEDLSRITLQDYVDTVVGEVTSRDLSNVVLVGHSLGGLTAPYVAARAAERIKRVVFLACAMPAEGDSMHDMWRKRGRPSPSVRQDGDWAGLTDEQRFRRMFCNDMEPRMADWMLKQLTPEPPKVFEEKVTRRDFVGRFPCTYVVHLYDQSVPVEEQRANAMLLGDPEMVDLKAGHDGMMTKPRDVARILLHYS